MVENEQGTFVIKIAHKLQATSRTLLLRASGLLARVCARPQRRALLVTGGVDGHRGEYLCVFSQLLPFCDVESEPLSVRRIVANPGPVFFLSIDDHLHVFLLSALTRFILGRRTVGLFLRAGECFRAGSVKYIAKYVLFNIVKRVPQVRIVSIVPFYANPSLRFVSSDWVDDPQFWDLPYVGGGSDGSPLSNEIRKLAQGRKIVVTLGRQDADKGFDFFAKIWCSSEELRRSYLFCSVGAIDARSKVYRELVERSGGVIVDRRISDTELKSIYRTADIVWSCYSPDYDQSSGIFGRSMQYGKASLVRSGSYLEKIGAFYSHCCLPLDFDDPEGSAQKIIRWNSDIQNGETTKMHLVWAAERSLQVLRTALRVE